jgi:hypothetical protein
MPYGPFTCFPCAREEITVPPKPPWHREHVVFTLSHEGYWTSAGPPRPSLWHAATEQRPYPLSEPGRATLSSTPVQAPPEVLSKIPVTAMLRPPALHVPAMPTSIRPFAWSVVPVPAPAWQRTQEIPYVDALSWIRWAPEIIRLEALSVEPSPRWHVPQFPVDTVPHTAFPRGWYVGTPCRFDWFWTVEWQ